MSKIDKPEVPAKVEDLSAAVQTIIDGVSDPTVAYGPDTDSYGKCVEAMWRAGYIAHEAVARELGVTGFQHGMSSLMVLGALRDYEGPFMVVNAANALYPQDDLVADVQTWLQSDDTRSWLADEAEKRLAERGTAAPRVIEHWRGLVANRPAEADK